MMPFSFYFEFSGDFGQGTCGLTIGLNKEDRGMIVVCSQRRNYYGISVTNALETIAVNFFMNVVKKNMRPVNPAGDPAILNQLRDLWKSELQGNPQPHLGHVYKRNVATWIEHYPAGTGLAMEDTFMEVWFDKEGNPSWLSARNKDQAKNMFGEDVIEAAFKFSRKD